jgi:hypothetical protein
MTRRRSPVGARRRKDASAKSTFMPAMRSLSIAPAGADFADDGANVD